MIIYAQQLRGLEADPLHVYAQHTPGEAFRVIGLTETAAREVRIRVASAFAHLGRELPTGAAVHVAPAGEARGASVDLAVAVAAAGVFAGDTVLVGELALDGRLRPVRGIYAHVRAARDAGRPAIIVPEANAAEAAVVGGIAVFAAPALDSVLAHLTGIARLSPVPTAALVATPETPTMPAHPASGEIAAALAAGKRRILLVAPVGAGTMTLARHVSYQLPPMTEDEMREATAVHGVAGLLNDGRPYVAHRPLRAPHHTVSEAGLVGGGDHARPGEVSLAHGGVLVLDSVPEFRAAALDALWHALDRGASVLRTRSHTATFPAAPCAVIGTALDCGCGWRTCQCTEAGRARYARDLERIAARFEVTIRLPSLTARQIASM